MRALYSGPLTYDTLTRKFSSEVDPLSYFNCKKQQPVEQLGQYVDIYDLGDYYFDF